MRKRLAALCLLLVMACTGCDSGITLTAEENELLAEYISSVLLKYSKEYQWKYSKLSRASAMPESTSQSVAASGSAAESALNPYASSSAQPGSNIAGEKESSSAAGRPDGMSALAEALGGGVTVSYRTYVTGSEYPQDGLVSVSAANGRKILAVEFTISNAGTAAAVCNGKSSKVALSLKVNGEKEYVQAGSILNYDVANMSKFVVEPGQSATGVALFMVPETVLSGIERLELTVAVGGQAKGSTVIKG